MSYVGLTFITDRVELNMIKSNVNILKLLRWQNINYARWPLGDTKNVYHI